MFDLDNSTGRRHPPEPDLVPILDGMTAVIFFMLLSISFVGITKITMPPSTTAVSSPQKEIPVSGRLIAKLKGNEIQLKLEWIGQKPGAAVSKSPRSTNSEKNTSLIEAVEKLAIQFKEKFPQEKTIQIAMDGSLDYQELISVMDGFRKEDRYQDLVLSSYTEVD
jgi:biopolymer transport protein ExbD